MDEHITLSGKDGKVLVLPVGTPEKIATPPPAEQDRGQCVIQFRLTGEAIQEGEPCNTLINWQQKRTLLRVESESMGRVDGCSLRECTSGPAAVRVQIYLPDSALRIRNCFSH